MSDDQPKTPEIPRLRPAVDAGGRWGAMARRLGLVPVAGGGIFGRRVRMLVGERGGFLVAVSPSHSLSASSVDVLVRFPQGHTVRGFREDLRRKLRRRRRRHVYVGDGSVLQRLPYTFVPPTVGAVERATDELVAAMADHVRPLERMCEACGGRHDLGLFLADGVPGVYCEACVASFVEGEAHFAEAFGSLAPDYGRGIGLGAAAAVAFGLVLGALAAIAIVRGGRLGPALALPAFVAAGYAASAVASRGFLGSSILAALAKLPLSLLSAVVTSTAMTAVSLMTVEPAEWNLVFLRSSLVQPIVSTPRVFALGLGAAAAGWLLETVVSTLSRRRPGRRTRIERVIREPLSE